MKKLPTKSLPWITPFILSSIMSALISMTNVIKTLGLVHGLFGIWAKAWLSSWAFAYPCLLIVLPFTKRLSLNRHRKSHK